MDYLFVDDMLDDIDDVLTYYHLGKFNCRQTINLIADIIGEERALNFIVGTIDKIYGLY